ncbi:hypothetical protein DFH09DRAFT_1457276 [Mycena vulgaris]|nr:hypothetical protein DFH09DRAFT_1457276 [Mycena vulgaris]
MSKFSFATTADEVATAFADEIKGKNVLITGTSLNGIGFEAARVIAKHAKLVVITGYNAESSRRTAIKKEVPDANIHRLVLDLSSLASVRKAAEVVNTNPEPLHLPWAPSHSPWTSWKKQFATDHVGPFLLTKLLAPKLLSAATASYTPRVVFVSSGAHAFGTGVDFAVLAKPDPKKYKAPDAYFQAKSANILMAIELSKRSKGAINAYSLHPGIIFTNIAQKEEAQDDLKALGMLGPDGLPNHEKWEWKTIPQGAATTVAAAFDPRINDKPGAYLEDSAVANEAVAAHSSDPAHAEKLWNITEKIIGESLVF